MREEESSVSEGDYIGWQPDGGPGEVDMHRSCRLRGASVRVARKGHACAGCAATIPARARYVDVSMPRRRLRCCAECWAAEKAGDR